MRILFCSFDSPGHLFPLVGLALELRRRGHKVAFATAPGATGVLDAVAIQRIPRGIKDGKSFRLNTHFAPLSVIIDVKHAEYAVEQFQPDLLLTHQLCYAPLLVRERQQIPVGVMGLFSYLWPTPGGVAAEATEQEGIRWWRLRSDIRVLNEIRETFRLPDLEADALEVPFLGDLFMVRSVPELEPTLAALPLQVHVVGACLWEPDRPEEGAWEVLRREFAVPNAPLVYVQQGRTFNLPGFWPQLVEALADREVQVVASVGRMDEAVETVPRNFVVRDHVPQGLVMPHARGVVTSGSTSAVLAALTHGLPSVVVPSGAETPDNAEKLAATGCAVRLSGEGLTAAALRSALERVLTDADLAANCRRIQAAFARTDSFDRAATLVETLATTRARVSREIEMADVTHAVAG